MVIKHLVISGGGPNLFTGYGALKKLHTENFWNLKNIETIHGTSAGAIIGLFIALNVEWETLDDYFIKRPWENVFSVSPNMIFDAYSKRGIYSVKIFEDMFEPFFSLNDMTLETTFQEFYDITKIDMNMYCTDLNSFELVCLNHKKNPEIPILQGLHATSAIPAIFSPVLYQERCLLDGGLLSNYPLASCFKSNSEIKKDEVLGLIGSMSNDNLIIKEDSVITDYIFSMIYRLIDRCDDSKKCDVEIEHELCYPTKERCGTTWKDSLLSGECREKMIKNGEEFAENYLSNLKPISKTVQEPDA